MDRALAALALLMGIFGLATLSEATTGVGAIAFGCLSAIGARILQASRHHKAHMAAQAARSLDTPSAGV